MASWKRGVEITLSPGNLEWIKRTGRVGIPVLGDPPVFDSLEDADTRHFPVNATIAVRSHSAGMLFYKLMEAESGAQFWRLTEES